MNLDVDLSDALCGFSTSVKGIDGANIPVRCGGGGHKRAEQGLMGSNVTTSDCLFIYPCVCV